MSRTFRTDPKRFIKVPDGQYWYKCKCSWCVNIKYRDRYGLTVKENLKANDETL